MKLTGKNLQLVRYGLSLAVDELHNQIATCPDVIFYADCIEQMEQEQEEFKKLMARIDAAIEKEKTK